MFQFPSKTVVEQNFKLNDLLKLINADKAVRTEAKNIQKIQMINAISEVTTGLKASNDVNEIYVIKIVLLSPDVPRNFIRLLDKTIKFQVLFEVLSEDKVKYISTFKTFQNDKTTQIKTFESEWRDCNKKELPLVTNLEEIYKCILEELYNLKFRQDEEIGKWIERANRLENLEKEFKKYEKLIKTEVQPRKAFELNEHLREIYKKIQEER